MLGDGVAEQSRTTQAVLAFYIRALTAVFGMACRCSILE